MSINIGATRSYRGYQPTRKAEELAKAIRTLLSGGSTPLHEAWVQAGSKHLGADRGDPSIRRGNSLGLPIVDQTKVDAMYLQWVETLRIEINDRAAEGLIKQLPAYLRYLLASPDSQGHMAERFPGLTTERAQKALRGSGPA